MWYHTVDGACFEAGGEDTNAADNAHMPKGGQTNTAILGYVI
jgi:hypothetical protein